MVKHKRRVPVAVVVVKSRLLDVTRSLETTPEETLLMAGETIDYCMTRGLRCLSILSMRWMLSAGAAKMARRAMRSS